MLCSRIRSQSAGKPQVGALAGNLRPPSGVFRSVRRFLCLWLGLAVVGAPAAEVIRGRVVSVHAGRSTPVEKALVTLSPRGSAEVLAVARTGAGGTFEFVGPLNGDLKIRVQKSGYDLLGRAGDEDAIYLDCSAACGPVELRLSPGALVTGVVTDDLGEAAPGVSVSIVDEGNRIVGRRANARIRTDDRGMFRISGIRPGVYELRASAPFRTAADVRYEIESIPIELEAGQELQLRLTVQRVEYSSYKVSGVVSGVELDPESGGRLIARRQDDGRRRSFRRGTEVTGIDPQGRFEFAALTPGDYTFQYAASSPRGPRRRRGRRPAGAALGRASIQGETTGLALAPVPKAWFSGRVEWVGEPGSRGAIYLRSLDGTSNAVISAALPDYTFRAEVLPGRYTLQNRSRQWFIESLTVAGRTIETRDFEIPGGGLGDAVLVLSREFATVEGVVRARPGDGSAAEHYQVELRGPGRNQTTQTDQRGRFRFDNLTPGDYRVAAWPGDSARGGPAEQSWRPFPIEAGAVIELAITAEVSP